jgi:hypothetical protein
VAQGLSAQKQRLRFGPRSAAACFNGIALPH